MTIFAWSLEFVTALVNLFIAIKIHHPESNIDLITCMVIFDAFLNFIIIPSSYIMNNEVMKTAIIAGGWLQIFRRRIQSNQVAPAENGSEKQNKVPAYPQPRPISTVSGNIKALKTSNMNIKTELDNDFKRLTAHNIFSAP